MGFGSSSSLSVSESEKRIIVNPEFQRNQLWKQEQKSRFIESVILNFPLPPIYLDQNKENKYIVIDGIQRTTAHSEFFDDKFALSYLEALPSYNGKRFSDLSEILQSKLENKKLTIFSLKPSTPLVVIYDLYKEEYKWAFVEGIDHPIDYDKGFLLNIYKHILQS